MVQRSKGVVRVGFDDLRKGVLISGNGWAMFVCYLRYQSGMGVLHEWMCLCFARRDGRWFFWEMEFERSRVRSSDDINA